MVQYDKQILIETQNLCKNFYLKNFLKPSQILKANQNINLTIFKGETLSIVGQSGSGKSTLGQIILALEKPTSGNIFYHRNKEIINLVHIKPKQIRILRKDLQIIFQDSYSTLNPYEKVSDILGEGLLIHKIVKNKKDSKYKGIILDIMEKCQIDTVLYERYTQELSGGQRQRISIARSLIINPKFVICDEIVSSLDCSLQIKILDLLQFLKKKYQLTFLFITHDLGVAKYISDRICVMYLGNIVEIAFTKDLFQNPQHPYTQKLLNAIPKLKKTKLNITTKNKNFDFLFETQTDVNWYEVHPNHFIKCTLKNEKKNVFIKS